MVPGKKILLTGGSGLLALNWAYALRDRYTSVLGVHERKPEVPGFSTAALGLSSETVLSGQLEQLRPDVVIHCAGLANVEACEADPALAEKVNVGLTENIVTVCERQGIGFIYIATDHLFKGEKKFAAETDEPQPLNEYGRTKLEGEEVALRISGNALSIRTNFYGWGPSYRRSFSDMIIDHLSANKTVSLFDDFFYTPILIEELADAVMELWNAGARGIFNVAGGERISKAEFGYRLAKRFGLNSSLINPVKFADRKDLVKRPSDLSLNTKKLQNFLGRNVGNTDRGIDRLFEQRSEGQADFMQNIH